MVRMGKSIHYKWVKADSQQVLISSKCFQIQLMYRKMLRQNSTYLEGLELNQLTVMCTTRGERR